MQLKWTIGRRISGGFGIVLLGLGVVVLFAVLAFGTIRHDLGEALACNALRNEIAQREIDHLKWAKQVSDLITDDRVTTLQVQTDPTKCAFGQWYYGDGRREAEELVPATRTALAAIEQPHQHLHASAVDIGAVFRQADAELPAFLAEKESDHLKWINACSAMFARNLPTLDVQTDDHACGLGQFLFGDRARKIQEDDPEMAALIEAIKVPHRQLHESALAIQQAWRQRHEGLTDTLHGRLEDHQRWVNRVLEAIIANQPDLGVQLDPTQCAFGRYLASDEASAQRMDFSQLDAALQQCDGPHQALHASAVTIQQALADGDPDAARRIYESETAPALAAVAEQFGAALAAEQEAITAQRAARDIFETQTLPALAATQKALEALRQRATENVAGMRRAGEIFGAQTTVALADVQRLLGEIGAASRTSADEHNVGIVAAARSTGRLVAYVGAFAVAAGILLAWLITRGIVRPVNRIVAELTDGSTQVTDAAGQVNASSIALAEASSEQASSLEETTAALEQMAAMTRANADHAGQASTLATKAGDAARASDVGMRRLTGAMEGINESSLHIGKIIKVIEEIAFQTNLLALNAAVEAARAGDHGKGFAVVADEVRALALRAAGAASETTSLIEQSITRANEGMEVTNGFAGTLGGIVETVDGVTQLVGSIDRASREQADGVAQINTAVGQMDGVTQSIAASAEESAAAVEELTAQAEAVSATARILADMVGRK